MTLRHVLAAFLFFLPAISFADETLSVNDFVHDPTVENAQRLAAQGNAHRSAIITALVESSDDSMRLNLLQTLVLIEEPSDERSAFLASLATDASLDSTLRAWAKVGRFMDAPTNDDLLTTALNDDDLTQGWSWGNLISVDLYGSRALVMLEALNERSTPTDANFELFIRLLAGHFPHASDTVLTPKANALVDLIDAGTPTDWRATTDALILLQEAIVDGRWHLGLLQRLLANPQFYALSREIERQSISGALEASLAACDLELPSELRLSLANYFISDEILRASADDDIQGWGARRTRLLDFGSILRLLLKKERPSAVALAEEHAEALLGVKDQAEVRALAQTIVVSLPAPLPMISDLLESDDSLVVEKAAAALRRMTTDDIVAGADATDIIIARLTALAFAVDPTRPETVAIQAAAALIHVEIDLSRAQQLLRDAARSSDQNASRLAVVLILTESKSYEAADVDAIANFLVTDPSDDERRYVTELVRDRIEDSSSRAIFCASTALGEALAENISRGDELGETSQYVLDLYRDYQ